MKTMPLKTNADVLNAIEEVFNDHRAGRIKHYDAKESANLIGKHLAAIKNGLMQIALGSRAEHLDGYFGRDSVKAVTHK